MENSDVFPQSVIERWHDWARLKMLTIHDIEQAEPFESKLEVEGGTKIQFVHKEHDDDTISNHIYTLNGLTTVAKGIRWYGVDRRLRRKKKPVQKNEDITLAFKWRNTFTTKKFFTFGVRHVAPGTAHVYQTAGTPMLVYLPKIPITDEEGTLDYSKDLNYQTFRVNPNTVLYLTGTYLILTSGKTLFAVDVVRTDVLPDIHAIHPIISQAELEPIHRELIQTPDTPSEIEQPQRLRLSKRPPKRYEAKRCKTSEISACEIPDPGPSTQPSIYLIPGLSPDQPGPSFSQAYQISRPTQEELELNECLATFYEGIDPVSEEEPISSDIKNFLADLTEIRSTDPELKSIQPYFPPATPEETPEEPEEVLTTPEEVLTTPEEVLTTPEEPEEVATPEEVPEEPEEMLEATLLEEINLDDYLDIQWDVLLPDIINEIV